MVLLTEAETEFAHPSVRDEPNLGKVWRLRGARRTELEHRELARADLDRALEWMTELDRPYDTAEVLLALGDWAVRGGLGPDAASDYLWGSRSLIMHSDQRQFLFRRVGHDRRACRCVCST
ncbi:hypothetical protein L3Q65_24220 [Amycolatopsis sp. FU40]|uniref:hypothetical protein n=1 Tax=Amycolatopsis sp. FU40 TaxID=2914159 RepID=UPI001F16D721|nr:hypothetical protein [Amycolatopsis sp. FU40]UKD51037.1 hypothetical protein L3Q65_24220 [Amycolatopsis sp. FU40]